ncbi:WASH complex subunit 1 [Gryllus bimaculatus]|nr:WASH complex subunit 1 [Gryllus bimaculatus]
MEAIRQAGGSGKANLRSAKQMKIETRKRMQEEKVSSSSDLMADLHAKLALRRKGISGANKTEVSVGNAMQRVSAMIPPPQFSEPESNLQEDEEGMDEDWD